MYTSGYAYAAACSQCGVAEVTETCIPAAMQLAHMKPHALKEAGIEALRTRGAPYRYISVYIGTPERREVASLRHIAIKSVDSSTLLAEGLVRSSSVVSIFTFVLVKQVN